MKMLRIVSLLIMLTGCSSISSSIYLQDYTEDNTPITMPNYSYKTSFGHHFAEFVIKVTGIRKIYSKNEENTVKNAKNFNKIFSSVPPKKFHSKYNLLEVKIDGNSCYIISKKKLEDYDKILVYIYGGGFMLEINTAQWIKIEHMVKNLDMPVIIPIYPIYPETSPVIINNYIHNFFNFIYEKYPDKKLIGIADSAGAFLWIVYCNYLTQTNAQRFPDHIIFISPAHLVDIDEETKKEMKAIGKKDILIHTDIIDILPQILGLNEEKPSWFVNPINCDFSRFPPITIFAGTNDIFYPLIHPLVNEIKAQNKQVDLYIGNNMIHDWPLMPIIPESRHAMDMIIELIKSL